MLQDRSQGDPLAAAVTDCNLLHCYATHVQLPLPVPCHVLPAVAAGVISSSCKADRMSPTAAPWVAAAPAAAAGPPSSQMLTGKPVQGECEVSQFWGSKAVRCGYLVQTLTLSDRSIQVLFRQLGGGSLQAAAATSLLEVMAYCHRWCVAGLIQAEARSHTCSPGPRFRVQNPPPPPPPPHRYKHLTPHTFRLCCMLQG
jgi:hypothetical protein